ncbi:hypothetical protein SAMN05421841_0328 [Chryseobacterium wanjuense]|uniref:Uncharacterized protein n=1 Tax=Chryseobacterium wanjuense TaxID=356305 RepID=A0A1I0N146_9FLAO|nr:hypothetical protein [Chryseobacterium wanjuense]SEV94820.1 hypothetical protein SAMN05421841_0328 [Chryseobacterium wanjuense]
MKKILLTATMLVGFAAVSQAQQGRVGINTNTPASTLDVVGTPTDATRPDALLVPRLTEDQLAAKNAVYVDGTAGTPSPQNGALVYVTAADGATTAKTANVTAPGIYYFDGSAGQNVWKTWGTGGSTPPNFQIQKGRLHSANAPIVWAADDYSVVTTGMGNSSQLLLPDATTLPLNSVRCVSSNGPGNVGWSPSAVAGITRGMQNIPSTVTSGGSFCFIVVDNAGTHNWGILSGR